MILKIFVDMHKGKLYVSDKGGSRFTLSLDNHLVSISVYVCVMMFLIDSFNVIQYFLLLCSHLMISMKYLQWEVYILQQQLTLLIVSETTVCPFFNSVSIVASHYSVITFNNGGSWQRITPPTGIECVSN